MDAYYSDEYATIYHANALDVLPDLEAVDLILADPPYSSGGLMRSDRSLATTDKYARGEFQRAFTGDNRDQRSYEIWSALWMRRALEACRPGASILSFIDWRNLPSVVDAIQVAGWVYRGIVPWDKGEATRPVKGWFRSQCEFLITGTCGAIDRDAGTDGLCRPGFLRYGTERGYRIHETQKPLKLLEALIVTRDDWQLICDPFMGSGTTLRAAKDVSRKAIGIEIDEALCEASANRLRQKNLF